MGEGEMGGKGSLGYGREGSQSRGLVSGLEFWVIKSSYNSRRKGWHVGVREVGARGGGRHEGVDRWVVRGVLRAKVLVLVKAREM